MGISPFQQQPLINGGYATQVFMPGLQLTVTIPIDQVIGLAFLGRDFDIAKLAIDAVFLDGGFLLMVTSGCGRTRLSLPLVSSAGKGGGGVTASCSLLLVFSWSCGGAGTSSAPWAIAAANNRLL